MSVEEAPRIEHPMEMKPSTFEELKLLGFQTCRRCGNARSTHTISVTAAKVGAGRGAVVSQIQRTPVCEKCGVDIFSVIKRALKM